MSEDRKSRRAFNVVAGLLALALVQVVAQENRQATLNGVVTGQEGKAVQAAFVIVRDYEQSSQDSQRWETRTAPDGSFSLTMPAGCYDIFVSANPVLLPWTQRICIEPERRSVLRIKLKTDPHPRLHLS